MPQEITNLLPASQPTYQTSSGAAYTGDSRVLLDRLPNESIDLVITSPPYALRREKEYGTRPPEEYNEWFCDFADRVYDVLTDDGSFVVEIGGGWEKGIPVRSIHHFELLTELAGSNGQFHLAQDCYWYNSAKLPTPAQWVTIKRERIKDAVNHVWILSKSPHPNADNRRVLNEYSAEQRELMKEGYNAGKRPSGHDISDQFDDPQENGSIPSNLIEVGNTNSRSHYLDACNLIDTDPHPSRFPRKIPEFFIKFLSETDDIVLDIFAGSNMTGRVAQDLNRQWLAFESKERYVRTSQLRFVQMKDLEAAQDAGLNGLGTITQVIPCRR